MVTGCINILICLYLLFLSAVVPRQFLYGHFVYDTSSTDISSTDISSITVYQGSGQCIHPTSVSADHYFHQFQLLLTL